ncbi:hypothetical protein G6F22_019712 [Rhizopus arrhizus]|nr:hypothetical protein G6F22_019712 [Rhizopus arrhizus]
MHGQTIRPRAGMRPAHGHLPAPPASAARLPPAAPAFGRCPRPNPGRPSCGRAWRRSGPDLPYRSATAPGRRRSRRAFRASGDG